MTRAEFSRARPGRLTRGLLLMAAAAAGCSGGDYGSVSPSPKASPDVVEVVSRKKGDPIPRVPRGPDQAKALQEAAKK